jgi:integrase/recombinase XerD
MNLFLRFLKGRKRTLLDVDRGLLREYISYLVNDGISYKTVENRFSTFSSFYDYVVYEGLMEKNIVLDIRKRYIRRYKKNDNGGSKRKLVNIEEMSLFINLIFDIEIKAIALVFAKTGIRLRELIAIDIEDIDWSNMSIELKPTPKRSNLVVFFDSECALVLKRWLKKRETIAAKNSKALFVSYQHGERIHRNTIYRNFTSWGEKAGLHNPKSDRLEDHFTPHCCRHWFTTHLRRAGMPREFIKELRGDKRTEAMDIYDHIDMEELRRSYLAHIPKLGI